MSPKPLFEDLNHTAFRIAFWNMQHWRYCWYYRSGIWNRHIWWLVDAYPIFI